MAAETLHGRVQCSIPFAMGLLTLQKSECLIARSISLMREGQFLPNHYHVFKSEDIINRAGGDIAVRLWNVDRATGKVVDGNVTVMMDGIPHVFAPGEEIVVAKGCSVTLHPYMAHVFGPKAGTGDTIIGEVSKVNDDHTDNYFLDPVARFADIEEDESPYRVLCNEYDREFAGNSKTEEE